MTLVRAFTMQGCCASRGSRSLRYAVNSLPSPPASVHSLHSLGCQLDHFWSFARGQLCFSRWAFRLYLTSLGRGRSHQVKATQPKPRMPNPKHQPGRARIKASEAHCRNPEPRTQPAPQKSSEPRERSDPPNQPKAKQRPRRGPEDQPKSNPTPRLPDYCVVEAGDGGGDRR